MYVGCVNDRPCTRSAANAAIKTCCESFARESSSRGGRSGEAGGGGGGGVDIQYVLVRGGRRRLSSVRYHSYPFFHNTTRVQLALPRTKGV